MHADLVRGDGKLGVAIGHLLTRSLPGLEVNVPGIITKEVDLISTSCTVINNHCPICLSIVIGWTANTGGFDSLIISRKAGRICTTVVESELIAPLIIVDVGLQNEDVLADQQIE